MTFSIDDQHDILRRYRNCKFYNLLAYILYRLTFGLVEFQDEFPRELLSALYSGNIDLHVFPASCEMYGGSSVIPHKVLKKFTGAVWKRTESGKQICELANGDIIDSEKCPVCQQELS